MPTLTIPFNAHYKMVLPFLSSYQTTIELDEFQPDIIHIATPSPMGHFALRYARKNYIPIISIYHTHFLSYVDYYLKNTPFLIEATRNQIAKRSKSFYDNCDLVYIPTQEMVDYLTKYHHETNHYKIWQRGINHQLFSPSKKNISVVKRITQNDKPNVLFASRLVWEKNLAVLVDFYRVNEANGSPYNLLIAGNGIAEAELRQQMPNAHFLGHVHHERLAVLYASSDVFFFPSVTETYGNVVVEAMASGLPCVIANGGGSKSFIKSGKNGFLAAPKNAKEYYEKITSILTQPDLKQQFIAQGLAYTANLKWDRLVRTYFEDLVVLYLQKRTVAA